jgi:hypothetical protein
LEPPKGAALSTGAAFGIFVVALLTLVAYSVVVRRYAEEDPASGSTGDRGVGYVTIAVVVLLDLTVLFNIYTMKLNSPARYIIVILPSHTG